MEGKCLVSVVVIAYNSAEFIIETLNSIYAQTYHNIELIIADDASTDHTFHIVQEWLVNHRDRFLNVKVICSEKNRGCTANLNSGLRACSGEYVYTIAADDIMYPEAIESKLALAKKYPDKIVMTRVENFGDLKLCRVTSLFQKKGYKIASYNHHKQYRCMLKRNFVFATSVAFFKLDFLKKNNYYDEQFKMLEDYPMWVKLMKQGYSFVFEDVLTAKYRIHNKSLSNSGTLNGCTESSDLFYKRVLKYELLKQHMYYEYICKEIGSLRYSIAKKRGETSFAYKISSLLYIINPYQLAKELVKILFF